MHIWIVETGEAVPGIGLESREWRCEILATALVSAGHSVTWWASTFDHAAKRHRADEARTITTRPGIEIRLLHGPGYRRSVSFARVRHQRVIARLFARDAATGTPPDMIFCCLPTPELAEQAVSFGRARGIPVVVDIRDLWPDVYLTALPPSLRGLGRLLLRPEFNRLHRALTSAAGLTAVSATYLRWALERAGRVAGPHDGVFPLGFQARSSDAFAAPELAALRARFGIRPGGLVLTFVGVLGASYDLETVVNAARRLQANGVTGVQVLCVGDGDKGASLRRLAGGLDNFVLTGWLDRRDVAGLLRLSTVGLAAYTADALQSLPNKPFEYMAAGLPILSSLRGEMETLLRDEQVGLQYQAGNAESLVAGITWLAAHEEARAEMSRRAQELFHRRFDAGIIYPQLVRHLEQVASSANGQDRHT